MTMRNFLDAVLVGLVFASPFLYEIIKEMIK